MKYRLNLLSCILEGDESLGGRAWSIVQDFQRLLPLDVRMISCTRSADEFDWACLHDERAELLQSEVILEGAQVEVECRHVKVAVAVLCSSVVE